MLKPVKIVLCLLVAFLILNHGTDLAYAASNSDILDGGFGLSSIDSDLRFLLRGITRLARPIVTIMTALAGMMVVLNIGGDHKQKIWNWILGIGLALNFGSILWTMWGGYTDIPAGHQASVDYSFKVFGESTLTDGGIDTLSQMMKYLLTFVVAGALAIKPIAVKLLLGLALADMSIRLALDLTDKDKVSWLVKNILKIGFYVFLIHNWLGIDGWNLMDMLSKGFQEIGFVAGNYGEAPLVSTDDISGTIDPKHNLAPDSIVNNMFKMFSMLYGSSLPQDASFLDKVASAGRRYFSLVTSPISSTLMAISLLVAVICAFLTAIEMFMARVEFYILALLAIPLLAFGVIKHFEYLAQNAIRAVFNCGVKVCVIAFLQAVICQMFTKYTNEIDKSLRAGPLTSATGTNFELLSMTLQLLLMSIIMFLIVSKIPKLIQGLLAGNPSLGGSDMTGTVMGAAGGAAAGVGMYVGAHAAAVSARKDAAAGKTVSAWKMSEMGQMGAALLRRAPITGAAWAAYQDVARFGASGNDNKHERRDPDVRPSKTNDIDGGNGGNGAVVGGGGGQPGGGDINNHKDSGKQGVQGSKGEQSSKDKASGQSADQGASRETPKQYHYEDGKAKLGKDSQPSDGQEGNEDQAEHDKVPDQPADQGVSTETPQQYHYKDDQAAQGHSSPQSSGQNSKQDTKNSQSSQNQSNPQSSGEDAKNSQALASGQAAVQGAAKDTPPAFNYKNDLAAQNPVAVSQPSGGQGASQELPKQFNPRNNDVPLSSPSASKQPSIEGVSAPAQKLGGQGTQDVQQQNQGSPAPQNPLSASQQTGIQGVSAPVSQTSSPIQQSQIPAKQNQDVFSGRRSGGQGIPQRQDINPKIP